MKNAIKLITIMLVLLHSGCTLTGNMLGKVVDDATDSDKYQQQYTDEGLQVDIDIILQLIQETFFPEAETETSDG